MLPTSWGGKRVASLGHGPVVEKPWTRSVLGSWRTLIAGALLSTLAACATGTRDYEQARGPEPTSRYEQGDPSRLATPGEPGFQEEPSFYNPRHLAGETPIRVALLLPLNSDDPNAKRVAKGLRDAAQLALFQVQRDDLVLLLKDTGGTPQGAAQAAQVALSEGAEIILGPVFADSVAAVAEQAGRRNVPVVAFSSDRRVAAPGVHLLSFQVEEEIRRVVRFAAEQQLSQFAALVPRNTYGDRVASAFEQDVQAVNGYVSQIISYDPTAGDFREPVSQLADYRKRRRSLEEQREALEGRTDEAAQRALARLEQAETWGNVPFQAVLLPDGGSTLRSLAPTLPYYDIDNRSVRFLGTGLWDDASLWKEKALQGGWFAAPPPQARSNFQDLFLSTFDYIPPRIASLGYDAVTLAAALANAPLGQRFTPDRLTNPNGFAGIDGIFRFLSTGGTERGLSILEIQEGQVVVVGPAPRQFETVTDPVWQRQGS